MKKTQQISDTLLIGSLLAIVGGFLDAYTYLCRGHVFANAQTGNIVLLGINLIEGQFLKSLYYFVPIISFALGIVIAEMIRHHFFTHPRIHWRQLVILLEIVIILGVSLLPQTYNMVCNSLVSFVCSLQVQSFRKFHGNPYASTMCTGNLRSAMEHFYMYMKTKENDSLIKSLQYHMIIVFFIVGAAIGAITVQFFNIQATYLAVIILIIVILFMFVHREG